MVVANLESTVMKRGSKKILVLAVLTLAVAAGWFGYSARHDVLDAYREWQRGPIPEAVSWVDYERTESETTPTARTEDELPATSGSPEAEETAEIEENEAAEEISSEPAAEEPVAPTEKPVSASAEFPATINLKIPFMLQAPTQNWDDLHGEACEEASAIMLTAYYEGEEEITIEEAEARIASAVAWETENLGYYLDTTSAETARMLREHFGLQNVQVTDIDSIDDIKERLTEGHPVIVPAYGKVLGNPNFRNGGPLYHMLVIKGYTETHFITNDPGTRRGADYVYDFDVLWNAIHDWNGGDVPNGAKVMIAVN